MEVGSTDAAAAGMHPLLQAGVAIGATLKSVIDVDPLFMTTAERAAALLVLQADEDRLAELKLRVLAAADDVSDQAGARSPGDWLARETHGVPQAGRREHRLAVRLARHEQLRAGLAAGDVSRAQAEVVVRALGDLPDDLGPELVVKAEAEMVRLCAEFGPRDLKRLGSRLLDVLAPDIADAAEERRLRELERKARARTRLSMVSLADGTTRINATIPTTTAAILKAQLHAFTSPRRHRDSQGHSLGEFDLVRDPASGERVAHDELLGQAFCALVERMPTDGLPRHGSTAVTVVATITLDKLLAGVGGGTLTSGEELSAGELRRLACQTGILPAVLGTKSEVLDLGRRARLFSGAQHKALTIRDHECRAEGCDIPAAWCEAHHLHPWSAGGRTDLADGALLCSRHHHLIHDPRYDHRWSPRGHVTFHRRT